MNVQELSRTALRGKADAFVDAALLAVRASKPSDASLLRTPLVPDPVEIGPHGIEDPTLSRVRETFSQTRLVTFTVSQSVQLGAHPLLAAARYMSSALDLEHEARHPGEQSVPGGGIVRIFDAGRSAGAAMSTHPLPPHQDALGNGGRISRAALFVESSGHEGPITYFDNVVLAGLKLADENYRLFTELFAADAITVLSRRARGLIKIISPVFYLDELGVPNATIRAPGRDVDVELRPSARDAYARITSELYGESSLAKRMSLNHPGFGVIFDNQHLAHGRTGYKDSRMRRQKRVLARKWWANSEQGTACGAFPGIAMHRSFAHGYSSASSGLIGGTWSYDPATRQHVRT